MLADWVTRKWESYCGRSKLETWVEGVFLTFYRFVFRTPSQLISVFELRGYIKRERLLMRMTEKWWLLHMTIMYFINWRVWPFPNESYPFFNRVVKNRESFFCRSSFSIFWQCSRLVDQRSEGPFVSVSNWRRGRGVAVYYSIARMGTGGIFSISLFWLIFFLCVFHIDVLVERRVRWIVLNVFWEYDWFMVFSFHTRRKSRWWSSQWSSLW